MFSLEMIIEYLAVSAIFALLLCVAYIKPLGILQECGYSSTKLWKWAKLKANMSFKRYALLALCCILTYSVLALCFSFVGEYAYVIGLLGYFIFFILYYVADKKQALKCPVKYTARFKRLFACLWLVVAIISYLLVVGLSLIDSVIQSPLFEIIKYAPLSFLILGVYVFISVANFFDKLFETPYSNRLIKRASAKLKSSSVTVVGITGSFGKTSVKVILAQLLESKYRVLATPASYNTPLGVSKVINSKDLDNYEVFIVEMGARHRGDIATLCELFPPQYSLITGICPQHLESFKTQENIVLTKSEIIGNTKNKCIVESKCFEMFTGDIQKCDCVKDVVADCCGVNFTLTLGKNTSEVHANLLGEHSAYNIGLAACLAYEMGVAFDDICLAIEGLGYIPHRLQPIECDGITVLDDAYNSNVQGAQEAIRVLKFFEGKKIVVTPGLVELGVLESQENFDLGQKLVGLDTVILIGETLITPVKEGYLAAGGDEEKLFIYPTLDKAQNALALHIEKHCTILFLNDLPDVY